VVREEFREWLERSDKKFNELLERFDKHAEETNRRFDENDRKFNELLERLDQHIDETNRRFEEMRDDMNKRFEAVNKRFEEMRVDTNKRFEEMRVDTNKRFEEMRVDTNKRFEEMRVDTNKRFEQVWNKLDWLSIELSPLMSRLGKGFESIVRRIIERSMGYKEGKIERLIAKDEMGIELEVDAYVHDDAHILYEVKSRFDKWDAYDFLRKTRIIEGKLKVPVKKVVICFTADDDSLEICRVNSIEIISPKEKEIVRILD
jgi:hypothetical protein